jgi:hypothetical protein
VIVGKRKMKGVQFRLLVWFLQQWVDPTANLGLPPPTLLTPVQLPRVSKPSSSSTNKLLILPPLSYSIISLQQSRTKRAILQYTANKFASNYRHHGSHQGSKPPPPPEPRHLSVSTN